VRKLIFIYKTLKKKYRLRKHK